MQSGRVAICVLGVLLAGNHALGVGLPVSFDVAIYQSDGVNVFDVLPKTNTGLLNPTDLDGSDRYSLGNADNGVPVYVTITVSDPGTADQVDRWMRITVHTGDVGVGWNGPSMFEESVNGETFVEITNMEWTHPDPGSPGVEPFDPSWYPDNPADPDNRIPLFYMMGQDGFLELPGTFDFHTPTYDHDSVQTTMDDWASGGHGYVFSRTSGVTSAIKLQHLPDPSGIGGPDYVTIPDFARHNQGDPGFTTLGNVSEVSVCLNYRSVPEPATLLLVLSGMALCVRRLRGARAS